MCETEAVGSAGRTRRNRIGFTTEQSTGGAIMLVLSRHRDESIMIGDSIVVTVIDIRGDKVRLGIQAPSDVAVHRQEVYDAIRQEKEGDRSHSQ
jgi:carbon storage regulator